MHISELRVFNFRNLENSTLTFENGVNVILGKNGQGKTNIIEAIDLLSLTKSFRTSENLDLIKWNETATSVFAQLSNSFGDEEIGVSIEPKRKTLFVNGNKIKSVAEYVGRLICVAFSPSDLNLLQGPPSGRRRFIDKHIVDISPSVMGSLLTYNRALLNKNKILKVGVSNISVLDTWNRILATEAVKINRVRREFIEALVQSASKVQAEFCPGDGALSMLLKSNLGDGELTEDSVYAEFEKYRVREIHAGMSLLGPHRDDLIIEIGGKDAKAFASQGQSRSIVLALTLGVIELLEEKRGESPLVLLDDVNSELDLKRSDAFFDLVLKQKRQIFITGTDASVGHLHSRLGYSVLTVENGRVSLEDSSVEHKIAAN